MNFFDHPISRSSDPETSHDAADQVKRELGTWHTRVYAQAAALYQEKGRSQTAQEIAARCVERFTGLPESYRKRCLELSRRGLLEVCAVRLCEVTNRRAATFKPVERNRNGES